MARNQQQIRQALREIAAQPQTARDFKNALGVGRSLRQRQAEVVSLSTSANTATVTISGDSVSNVPYFTCLPCPTYSVWTVTDGEDLYITDTMGPAPVTKFGRSANWTHNSSGNELNVPFSDPTTVTGAWDPWGLWTAGSPANEEMPVPAPGIYRFTGQLSFVANATNRRYALIKRSNGNEIAREDEHTLTNTIASMSLSSAARVADATDVYFTLVAFQNSTANLDVKGDTLYSPTLEWEWSGLV